MLKNTLTEINLRLKMLYDMIPDCTKIGDVGTDHGFLPIYAVENDRCKYAIASDLREGPLKIAKNNIKISFFHDQVFLDRFHFGKFKIISEKSFKIKRLKATYFY